MDLWIAVCALLVSTLTAAAAVYQGRLISNQLSVTVWPYILFHFSSSENEAELDIQNVGTGPAIIRSAALYVDGKETSLSAALQTFGIKAARNSTTTLTNLSPGGVIRAGDAAMLLHVHSSGVGIATATVLKRTALEICYCSLLDQCWLKTLRDDYPRPIGACDAKQRHEIRTE